MRVARGFVVVMLLAAAIMASAQGTRAPSRPAVVLLDASFSMTGFFTRGSICPIVNDIQRSLEETQFNVHGIAFMHDSQARDVSSAFTDCSQVEPRGQLTLIDHAYSRAIQPQAPSNSRPATVWVITDNVQDPHVQSQENGDIVHFYNVLEQSAEEVHLFIRTPAFSGPLYGRDGSSPLGHYDGNRGLLIYAILLDRSGKESFESAIQKFGARKSPDDPVGTRVKGFSPIPVETDLVKAGDPVHFRRSPSDAMIVFDKVFSEGDKIKCAFQINFRHGPENLTIDRAKVEVKVIEPFRLYVGNTDFSAKEPELHATPPILDKQIVPIGANGASNQAVQVFIEFPSGVQFPHSLRYLLTYLGQDHAAVYKGKISVALKVKKSNIGFAPSLVNRYNAGEEYFREVNPDQSRIYGLESLFQQLNSHSEEYVDIPAMTIPVEFSVSPPEWPLPALLVLVVLMLILLSLLGKFAVGPEFQLETMGAMSYRLSPRRARPPRQRNPSTDMWGPANAAQPELAKRLRLRLFSKTPLAEDGRQLGELRRSPWDVQVKARSGYSVNGGAQTRLSRQGGSFTFAKADGVEGASAQNGVTFVRPRQTRQRGARGSDNIFDS
jgi:hypothetical protein